MLTKRQIAKIQKSISNGTGTDIKISKTQIGKSMKHGGNLFTSLACLGTRVLPYAVKGISKAFPALATGAVSALGELRINKIFGKGISITKKIILLLPPFRKQFTNAPNQQSLSNRRTIGYQTNRKTNSRWIFWNTYFNWNSNGD